MRFAAVVLVVAMAAGCTKQAALIAGGTTLALDVGIGYLAVTAADDCHNCTFSTSTADWAVPVGIGVVIIALTALAYHYAPDEDAPKKASGSPAPAD